MSVDFIGQKVNEINGSGSDVVFEDHKGKIILNKIDEVVKHLKGILNKSK